MEFHDVANIFPMMGDEEYKALVADIKTNGLHQLSFDSINFVCATNKFSLDDYR
jgi:hypothetical protein